MIVSGAGVTRAWERETALINTSDIFATLLDIAQTWVTQMHDSQSFQALLTDDTADKRKYAYAEVWGSNQAWHTIRDETYKLLILDLWTRRLYNLIDDPYEANNLLKGNWASTYDDIVERLQWKINEIRN
jgi:arylsulfatase A-like enzyme